MTTPMTPRSDATSCGCGSPPTTSPASRASCGPASARRPDAELTGARRSPPRPPARCGPQIRTGPGRPRSARLDHPSGRAALRRSDERVDQQRTAPPRRASRTARPSPGRRRAAPADAEGVGVAAQHDGHATPSTVRPEADERPRGGGRPWSPPGLRAVALWRWRSDPELGAAQQAAPRTMSTGRPGAGHASVCVEAHPDPPGPVRQQVTTRDRGGRAGEVGHVGPLDLDQGDDRVRGRTATWSVGGCAETSRAVPQVGEAS